MACLFTASPAVTCAFADSTRDAAAITCKYVPLTASTIKSRASLAACWVAFRLAEAAARLLFRRGEIEHAHRHASAQIEEVERAHDGGKAGQAAESERRQIGLLLITQQMHGRGGHQGAAREHLLRFGHARGVRVAGGSKVVLQSATNGVRQG